MSQAVVVQIVGAPIACEGGVKDSWRAVARWVADKLTARFGEAVQVHYFDLFDADCPPMPVEAQLPLVTVAGEVVSRGGKISVRAIERKVESIAARQAA